MNATVFADGATGAGKTHTMMGSAEDPGMIPRAVSDLYGRDIEGLVVEVQYMEIYNERIYDLLATDASDRDRKLAPQEDIKNRTVLVAGLSKQKARSAEQLMALIAEAIRLLGGRSLEKGTV